jgi:hypothetical protein
MRGVVSTILLKFNFPVTEMSHYSAKLAREEGKQRLAL